MKEVKRGGFSVEGVMVRPVISKRSADTVRSGLVDWVYHQDGGKLRELGERFERGNRDLAAYFRAEEHELSRLLGPLFSPSGFSFGVLSGCLLLQEEAGQRKEALPVISPTLIDTYRRDRRISTLHTPGADAKTRKRNELDEKTKEYLGDLLEKQGQVEKFLDELPRVGMVSDMCFRYGIAEVFHIFQIFEEIAGLSRMEAISTDDFRKQ